MKHVDLEVGQGVRGQTLPQATQNVVVTNVAHLGVAGAHAQE
jgi:hypothetical protein